MRTYFVQTPIHYRPFWWLAQASRPSFLLFLLFIVLSSKYAVGQTSAEKDHLIDSLKQVVSNHDDDVEVVRALIEWDNLIYHSDPKLDFELNVIIDSICALHLGEDLSDNDQYFYLNSRAFAYNSFGITFDNAGDHAAALANYNKSIEIREGLGDSMSAVSAISNLGVIYYRLGDYDRAFECYKKSLRIEQSLGDSMGMAGTYSNMGLLYHAQAEYDWAMEHFTLSLGIQQRIGDKYGVAINQNNMGLVNLDLGEFEVALEHYMIAVDNYREIGDSSGLGASYSNIGSAYRSSGDLSMAMEYFIASFEIFESISDKRGLTASQINIGRIHMDRKNYVQAELALEAALERAQKGNFMYEAKEGAKAVSELYSALGRHDDALVAYKLFASLKDSLDNEESQKKLIRQRYELKLIADSVKAVEEVKVKDALIAAEKAENEQHVLQAKQDQQLKYFLYAGLIIALLFGAFIYNRLKLITRQKEIIEDQKQDVEEKQQEILDSITYAKRIQSAILPPERLVRKCLPDSFILYKPKDIVAGDFYWIEAINNGILFAAADCTGHGVPGAMVSVVCNNALNRSVREFGLTVPGEILDKTREIVISEFAKSEEEVKDGMDIALCALMGTTLHYAGAHNPLWVARHGAQEMEELKADRQPIGKYDAASPFTTQQVELNSGDTVYVFTDGIVDQFGGEKGKKLKAKAFRAMLMSMQGKALSQQMEEINQSFEQWKGKLDQIDDVCVIGVRIP